MDFACKLCELFNKESKFSASPWAGRCRDRTLLHRQDFGWMRFRREMVMGMGRGCQRNLKSISTSSDGLNLAAGSYSRQNWPAAWKDWPNPLEKHVIEVFPQLKGLRFTHHYWGGPVFVTMDMAPVIGYPGNDKKAIGSPAHRSPVGSSPL